MAGEMTNPDLTKKELRDIEDVKRLLKYLDQGWSISVAISKAGMTPQRYTELRSEYTSLKETVARYYQFAGNK